MPRLFFAIKTPKPLIKDLVLLQDQLARMLDALRPPPSLKPERLVNSHCTLRFLGDVESSRIDRIIQAVHGTIEAAHVPPFDVVLTQCGAFTSRAKARVLWIGLDPEAPFRQLQTAIDAGLRMAGFTPEVAQPLHPHLTLFRFREPYRLPSGFALPDRSGHSPHGSISEVELVESKTLPDGAHHQTLASFSL
ncbi:MAG: RNA 2',3'-cyclic phosphodiesterase [Bacteroidota bacterium]|nr:RNA 2',3'-cyclic phosphodiesterase [Bacteroidota bacterium]MDP4242466.1 RNA 2',3'-cyclic phosphodiesterase [Bacteroidota bacterium]MDP4289054.1 RNA 2',3'-cyclic phosphodiesterase [Bacteroidota bacterium]